MQMWESMARGQEEQAFCAVQLEEVIGVGLKPAHVPAALTSTWPMNEALIRAQTQRVQE
jgi:hypothetical protein